MLLLLSNVQTDLLCPIRTLSLLRLSPWVAYKFVKLSRHSITTLGVYFESVCSQKSGVRWRALTFCLNYARVLLLFCWQVTRAIGRREVILAGRGTGLGWGSIAQRWSVRLAVKITNSFFASQERLVVYNLKWTWCCLIVKTTLELLLWVCIGLDLLLPLIGVQYGLELDLAFHLSCQALTVGLLHSCLGHVVVLVHCNAIFPNPTVKELASLIRGTLQSSVVRHCRHLFENLLLWLLLLLNHYLVVLRLCCHLLFKFELKQRIQS